MGANVTVDFEEKDLGWKEIKKQIRAFKNSYTGVGYYSDGGTDPKENIAARALIQEIGAKIVVTEKMQRFWIWKFGKRITKKIIRIPKRPFMRRTFEKNLKRIKKRIDIEYNKVLEGKQTAKQALSRIGEWYVGLIKLTIRRGGFVPNSPLTVSEKGSTKPLVDTGEMITSTTHREFMK